MLESVKYADKSIHSLINMNELCKHFKHVCLYTSNTNENSEKNIAYKQLLAIGNTEECIVMEGKTDFTSLQKLISKPDSWKFGYLSYDIKNSIEKLESNNEDDLYFPLLTFFIPSFVIEFDNNSITIHFDNSFITTKMREDVVELIFSKPLNSNTNNTFGDISCKLTQNNYIKNVEYLKHHIQQGNIYEINYCFEFFVKNANINPFEVFKKLNQISHAPFASFCKFDNHYVISSSPERFIKKNGNKLISQPIKGTQKRSKNIQEDEKIKKILKDSLKDKTENVMIVDLVRNDLSKIAERGSVKVEELFEVYTFQQVHQMISTVSCSLKENISFTDIIKALFPMGSMTGAPKIKAMQLIEEIENTKRGLYSGSIGYIKPNGDFDFNVVIRTILYNSQNKYASLMVGSAITSMSEPIDEYEECLLKAKAMIETLQK